MRFHSILSPLLAAVPNGREPDEPDFFHDLNLDQVVESITAGRDEYDLTPFFRAPVRDVATVRYRHEVLRDLEAPRIRQAVDRFADRMRTMRKHLERVRKLYYRYQKEFWFVDAVDIYCDAVHELSAELARLDLTSTGLGALRDYLTDHVGSTAFTSLVAETTTVQEKLRTVRYCVHIKGGRVTVTDYAGEADYSVKVERTFAKFQQGAVGSHLADLPDYVDMNHVEEQILALVARLNPDAFATLNDYCDRHRDYLDTRIATFDREVQFYLAYLAYLGQITSTGLPTCYPRVSTEVNEFFAREAFDIALAHKLVAEKAAVVCNDFDLHAPERVLVVTGPNQGGKTTFARMIGQLHYLAGLGLPVPARDAHLLLPDRIFTHFERQENIENLRGKLDDELVRVHDILGNATEHSVVIMNESFSSTTLNDSLFLGKEVLRKLFDLGPLCVYVSFVDELADLGPNTVSMVSTVDPDDATMRTFKVVRKPADGLAYAAALAGKYGLTYESLRRRVAR